CLNALAAAPGKRWINHRIDGRWDRRTAVAHDRSSPSETSNSSELWAAGEGSLPDEKEAYHPLPGRTRSSDGTARSAAQVAEESRRRGDVAGGSSRTAVAQRLRAPVRDCRRTRADRGFQQAA